jgi:uncharacterized protein
MKFLVLLLILLVVVWFIQAKAGRAKPTAPKDPPRKGPAALPQDMVECPICLVHLPRTEALPGPGGQLYCCAEHAAKSGA